MFPKWYAIPTVVIGTICSTFLFHSDFGLVLKVVLTMWVYTLIFSGMVLSDDMNGVCRPNRWW